MSVYKDSKRNTYYVSYSIKDPVSQKFHHVTKRGFKTKKEAAKWERENRDSIGPCRTALFIDIAKEWDRANESKSETLRHHKEDCQKRFAKLQNRPIQSISKADLIEWRSELGTTDYSTNVKNSTIGFVKSVFAYNSDIYGAPNPATMLKRFKKTDKEIMREMEVWTPDEFERFRNVVSIRVYRLYFEFLFWTGCRRGEAVALQKSDLSDGWATIRYSQEYACNGLQPTKTKQTRRIRLDEVTWNDIKPLLSEGTSSYVFSYKNKPLCVDSIQKQFSEGIVKSRVKKIRIHDLRHSHATWLINNGVNIVAVSKRLGHATIEQTLKTYTHLLSSTDQGMMSKMNEFRESMCETTMRQNGLDILENDQEMSDKLGQKPAANSSERMKEIHA